MFSITPDLAPCTLCQPRKSHRTRDDADTTYPIVQDRGARVLPSPGSSGCSARGMLCEGLNLSLGWWPLSSLGLTVCLPNWP